MPDAITIARKTHIELIEIIRRCPRSIFFASSPDVLNVVTLNLNATLTVLRVLQEGKAAEDYLDTIREQSEPESEREGSIRSSDDEQ